jgi:hypothetical protein
LARENPPRKILDVHILTEAAVLDALLQHGDDDALELTHLSGHQPGPVVLLQRQLGQVLTDEDEDLGVVGSVGKDDHRDELADLLRRSEIRGHDLLGGPGVSGRDLAHRLPQQLFLAPHVVIERGPIRAHHVGNIVERRGLIALVLEDNRGGVDQLTQPFEIGGVPLFTRRSPPAGDIAAVSHVSRLHLFGCSRDRSLLHPNFAARVVDR